MKYGIKEEYWKKLCELFAKKPKIEKVILYGSRAKGTYKPSPILTSHCLEINSNMMICWIL